MIKRTLYFGNPVYLSLKDEQLLIRFPEVEKNDTIPEQLKFELVKNIPIEDIGVIVLDHKQITITQALLSKLLENNCAVITCNDSRIPEGLWLPLEGNTLQKERFEYQVNASLPLKKQLWQQTVIAKIENQATLLNELHSFESKKMLLLINKVRSGDPDNIEAKAAAYYWKNIFPTFSSFTREREGLPPNNLLNYGYAILRAIVARALMSSGLFPIIGIHHHNRYNAYCLADDIMEPYRPYVDKVVYNITQEEINYQVLTSEIKSKLLQIPILDVKINGKRSPLMSAASITTTSLYKCFEGSCRKVAYPNL